MFFPSWWNLTHHPSSSGKECIFFLNLSSWLDHDHSAVKQGIFQVPPSPDFVIVTRYHLTYPQRKAFCSYSIWDTYYLNRSASRGRAKSLKIINNWNSIKFELLTQYQKVLWSCWSSQSWTWSGVSVGPLCWPRIRNFRRNQFRPFRHFMQFQWIDPFRSLTSSRFRKDDWDRNPRSVISMDSNTNSGMLSGGA